MLATRPTHSFPPSSTHPTSQLRQGLNKDLGFSNADRTDNIRRIGDVARLSLSR
jgi:hypothetical protein